eukprot:4210056-Prorocentrum_lima.AAC.1
MQQQPVHQTSLPPSSWAPHVKQQRFPIHVPAVSPRHLLVNMQAPQHQGNHPALSVSAGHE